MTSSKTRRSVRSLDRMTRADSKAWMDAHRADLALPSAEVAGVSITGSLDHPVMGDGWDSLWWTTAAGMHSEIDREADEVTFAGHERAFTTRQLPSGTTRRRIRTTGTSHVGRDRGRLRCANGELVASDADRYEETRPQIQRGRVHITTIPTSFEQVASRNGFILNTPDDQRFFGSGARRSALSQIERSGSLTKTTIVEGESVPRELGFDRHRGWLRSERGRTVALADVFSESNTTTAEEMVCDPTSLPIPEVVGHFSAQVVEWVQNRLTPRQWDCLTSDDLSSSTARVTRHQAKRIIEAEMPTALRIRR